MTRHLYIDSLIALMLAACAATPAATPTAPPATTDPTRTQYPVTIQDCGGRSTTYAKAPERVVTIDPSVTEMLLLLGLGDRIVGYTEFYPPEQQWAPVKADLAKLTMLNDPAVGYPSKEAIVAAAPDLVTSVYSYAFMDPLPDRDGWTKLGIASYETVGECYTAPPADFSLLYQDLRNFGIMFDVQARAEAEIAKLQSRVATLQQKAQDAGLTAPKIALYDGTVDHPPTYGGQINAVIELAGASYVWRDLDPNVTASWEQFVDANPDVLWIVPDAGTPAEDLEHQLETDPRFSALSAVTAKAYIVVPQADATIESPRLVDGLEKVIDGLIALR